MHHFKFKPFSFFIKYEINDARSQNKSQKCLFITSNSNENFFLRL